MQEQICYFLIIYILVVLIGSKRYFDNKPENYYYREYCKSTGYFGLFLALLALGLLILIIFL